MSDEAYIRGVLQELVKIPSINPPGNENVIAERVAGLLKEIGVVSRVDHVSKTHANTVGFLNEGNAGPALVLNGHLDTVPVKEDWTHPPFAGEVVGTRMYGLGAADMKGGVASMIGAVKMLLESKAKIEGSLILSFVADEEGGNAGTRHFLNTYRNLDYAVIGEPTGLNIVVSHRGVMRFRISTFGRAGHASNPSQGTNAIYKMNTLISRLMKQAETYSMDRRDYSASPSLSVSMIHGGTAENIIPARCEIIIDRRTTYDEKMKDVEGEIRGLLGQIEKKDDEFKYSFETTTAVEAWKVKDDSLCLRYGDQAYQTCFHEKPEFTDLGATCEAALFAAKGIDTFVFGPGNIENAHAKDEYVEIDQLTKAAQYYYLLIKQVLVDHR